MKSVPYNNANRVPSHAVSLEVVVACRVYVQPKPTACWRYACLDILLYNSHNKQLASVIPNAQLTSTGSSQKQRLLATYIHTRQWALHINHTRSVGTAIQMGPDWSSEVEYCTVRRLHRISNRADDLLFSEGQERFCSAFRG